ncbi:MAG: phosphatase PAP2 family protein [Methylotenera sp.]
MLEFDNAVLSYLNHYVGVSPRFDAAVVFLSWISLLKMTPLILILWSFWFIRDGNTVNRRKDVVLVFLGSCVAMAIARGLSLFLPFRLRPLFNPDLMLHIPKQLSLESFDHLSSMPSDHAALAFAIAMGIFLMNRVWGSLALLHAAFIICLPRAYLSIHYPTDLIAGAVLGVLAAWVTMRLVNIKGLADKVMAFEHARPATFYSISLLFSSQMMQMFNEVRIFGTVVKHMVSRL